MYTENGFGTLSFHIKHVSFEELYFTQMTKGGFANVMYKDKLDIKHIRDIFNKFIAKGFQLKLIKRDTFVDVVIEEIKLFFCIHL